MKLPMTCRNGINDIKTWAWSIALGEARKKPAYCLRGVRHIGIVNLVWALVWNVGTCRPDAKGDIQAVAPQGLEYQSRAQGRNVS
jgi:hypothetical protein